jgi:hypothetical protein
VKERIDKERINIDLSPIRNLKELGPVKLGPVRLPKRDCRCKQCGLIHARFIELFGKWPEMTHEEGQTLVRNLDHRLAAGFGPRPVNATKKGATCAARRRSTATDEKRRPTTR